MHGIHAKKFTTSSSSLSLLLLCVYVCAWERGGYICMCGYVCVHVCVWECIGACGDQRSPSDVIPPEMSIVIAVTGPVNETWGFPVLPGGLPRMYASSHSTQRFHMEWTQVLSKHFPDWAFSLSSHLTCLPPCLLIYAFVVVIRYCHVIQITLESGSTCLCLGVQVCVTSFSSIALFVTTI